VNVGGLSQADLASRLRRDGVCLRTGPFVIHLETPISGLAAALHFLYADFPLDALEGLTDFHVRVIPSGGLRRWWRPQTIFMVDRKIPFTPTPAGLALPMLEWGLNWCVGFHAHQFVVLHSAVVERSGMAVLLPGRPGSGKSTLCAALVNRGWRLLSDEFALLRPHDGRLTPLPRPISLKNQSIDVIREFAPGVVIGPAVRDTHKGTVAYMRPPADSVIRATEPAVPAWVIFPAFEPGAVPRLEPLPKARALLRLADNSFNHSLRGVQGFEVLTGLIDSCDSYEFEYGDLESALKLVDSLEPRRATFPAGRPAPAVSTGPESRPAPPGEATAPRSRAPVGSWRRGSLLLEALSHPEALSGLSVPGWDRLLFEARQAGMLARLGARVEEVGLLERIPGRAREQLTGAQALAAHHERMARWEINRIQRALAGTGIPIVLLKGTAYIMAQLPAARGRLFSDVDFMVPKEQLATVEEALLRHGWQAVKLDAYDQRYYREWMHELPPLQHRDRHTVVDVHHTILPESGRLHPDPRHLLQAARPVQGRGLSVLAPAHMVLHSAAHLFQDGDLQAGLQNLTDLDELLRHFGSAGSFWDDLIAEADRLGLRRPLFYALRYTAMLLDTPIPARVAAPARAGQPARPLLAIMDGLVTRALAPELRPDRTVGVARWLLYVRSHWLRMPPLLLARHLLRKSLKRTGQSAG
jgi:HprK-related kinase A